MLDLPDRVTQDVDDEKTTTKSKTSKDKDDEADEELEQDEVKAAVSSQTPARTKLNWSS